MGYVRCGGKYKKLFSFGRKLSFQEIRVNLLLLHLGLESLLGRLNRQSSHVIIISFSMLNMNSSLSIRDIRDILSHIIQAWPQPPQKLFPWTPHEIWLKTKINLQFQLYCSRELVFSDRIFIQKKEILVSQPPNLDHSYFRKSEFVKLSILFDYKCTQVCFHGWWIEKSWLQSQTMNENTYFEPISASLWHF